MTQVIPERVISDGLPKVWVCPPSSKPPRLAGGGGAAGAAAVVPPLSPPLAGAAAEETATEEAAAEDPPAEEAPAQESAEAPLEISGNANAVVNVGSNIRNGPGIIYAVVNEADPGVQLEVVGRSGDSLWLDVIIYKEEQAEGWIYAPLVTVQDGLDVATLPVTAASARRASCQ